MVSLCTDFLSGYSMVIHIIDFELISYVPKSIFLTSSGNLYFLGTGCWFEKVEAIDEHGRT